MSTIYIGLWEYGGQMGRKILYPITIFVIYLHEFGHAVGALITGGTVESIKIRPDGSGVTSIRGGIRPIYIMGGYIGSALFGNILFYIGARKQNWVKPTLILTIMTMLGTGIIWFWTPFTTAILFVFATALFFIGFKTKFGRDALMFLGLASVIFIIQNTAYTPSIDLRNFEKEVGFLSAQAWMYIWLAIALGILALNIRMLWGMPESGTPQAKA